MAFIGKQNRSTRNKQPDVQVTVSGTRIGFVFRNGIMAMSAKLDMLVGINEDFGYVKLVPGDRPVRPIGKKGLCCSWSASRAAVANLPDMKKYKGATAHIEEGGAFLISLNLTCGSDATTENMGL